MIPSGATRRTREPSANTMLPSGNRDRPWRSRHRPPSPGRRRRKRFRCSGRSGKANDRPVEAQSINRVVAREQDRSVGDGQDLVLDVDSRVAAAGLELPEGRHECSRAAGFYAHQACAKLRNRRAVLGLPDHRPVEEHEQRTVSRLGHRARRRVEVVRHRRLGEQELPLAGQLRRGRAADRTCAGAGPDQQERRGAPAGRGPSRVNPIRRHVRVTARPGAAPQASSPSATMCSGSRSLSPYMKRLRMFSENRLASVDFPTASATSRTSMGEAPQQTPR